MYSCDVLWQLLAKMLLSFVCCPSCLGTLSGVLSTSRFFGGRCHYACFIAQHLVQEVLETPVALVGI